MVDEGVVKILDTTTGQPLPVPTTNDTDQVGELVAENTQVDQQDVAVGIGHAGRL